MGTLKVINNFLDKSEINLLRDFMRIKHRLNNKSFLHEDFNQDTWFYGDPVIESLMINKQKVLEKYSNCELLPTFSEWKLNTHGAEVESVSKREACEFTCYCVIDFKTSKKIYKPYHLQVTAYAQAIKRIHGLRQWPLGMILRLDKETGLYQQKVFEPKDHFKTFIKCMELRQWSSLRIKEADIV